MQRLQISLDDALVNDFKATVKQAKSTHGIKISQAELIRQLLINDLNNSHALNTAIDDLVKSKKQLEQNKLAYEKELQDLKAKYGLAVKTYKKPTQQQSAPLREEKEKPTQPTTPTEPPKRTTQSMYKLPNGKVVEVFLKDGEHVYKNDATGLWNKLPEGSCKVDANQYI